VVAAHKALCDQQWQKLADATAGLHELAGDCGLVRYFTGHALDAIRNIVTSGPDAATRAVLVVVLVRLPELPAFAERRQSLLARLAPPPARRGWLASLIRFLGFR
jgi:hypothetical protein